MIAGLMRYRLELLEPVVSTNDYGEEVVAYRLLRTVRAERVRHSGSRRDEAGEHFADYSVEFNVRDAHPVSENWRVRELGGFLYSVEAVVRNAFKGFKTLRCSRVNE